jgi:hypothetical protein
VTAKKIKVVIKPISISNKYKVLVHLQRNKRITPQKHNRPLQAVIEAGVHLKPLLVNVTIKLLWKLIQIGHLKKERREVIKSKLDLLS